jgi:predicted GNAT family N-acyltransferase
MLLHLTRSHTKEEQDLNSNLKINSIKITEPQTAEQFEAYYLTRFETLRKPWGQPPGSEKDDQENNSIHIMAVNDTNEVLGVCRLQFNSSTEVQLRFMGVQNKAEGMGIGRKLIEYAEEKARQQKAAKMILQARETAVEFYKKCGYNVVEKSFLMWDSIQHYLMEKKL